jgi:hypothetical protein
VSNSYLYSKNKSFLVKKPWMNISYR